ncbi:UDP-3-O-acyl-N-acetylglucosamine deacetylase [Patescibacteria group bacterium]|nr:UDP-3-O-acyl-N-acetylglucosamine deacetylase [Patescibacteria group bacterium]MBU1457792.1 UDP-3-O-acyl-N-acetylglucosamine deacetylase [Patescibacteria group bacterium]
MGMAGIWINNLCYNGKLYTYRTMKLKLIESREKQRTVKKKFNFRGFSFFSGENVSMICEPSKENTGIVFYCKGVRIPAIAENIKLVDVHTTALTKRGVDILAIEHLMAAIWGLGIDNLIIRLSSNVVPAQSGSAEEFTKALLKAEIVEQEETRQVVVFDESTTITQPEFKSRFAKFEPFDKFDIKCFVPFLSPIGEHTVFFNGSAKSFVRDVCWARTFLRSPIDINDLTKWNGIRSVFKVLPEDPKKSPIITFTERGFLTPLKKEDEPARHKLLDLIGDLALVGYRLRVKLTVNEPGHKFTHLVAKKIRSSVVAKKNDS